MKQSPPATNSTVIEAATRKIRNVARGLLQLYGTRDMKQRLWDHEFAVGRWRCLEVLEGDCLPSYIAHYARGGSVLDLGCGPGARVNALSEDGYTLYTGVDVSAVAVEKAQRQSKKGDKIEYVVEDICKYVPRQKYDVIVFAESLYYISVRTLPGLLARYAQYLNPAGVFLATFPGGYSSILHIIESQYRVLEKQTLKPSGTLLLTFGERTQ